MDVQEWLAVVAGTDDRPAVREMAKRALDELAELREGVRTHCYNCRDSEWADECDRREWWSQ